MSSGKHTRETPPPSTPGGRSLPPGAFKKPQPGDVERWEVRCYRSLLADGFEPEDAMAITEIIQDVGDVMIDDEQKGSSDGD